jgi:hypothetical protein
MSNKQNKSGQSLPLNNIQNLTKAKSENVVNKSSLKNNLTACLNNHKGDSIMCMEDQNSKSKSVQNAVNLNAFIDEKPMKINTDRNNENSRKIDENEEEVIGNIEHYKCMKKALAEAIDENDHVNYYK